MVLSPTRADADLAAALRHRRQRLAQQYAAPVALWSGGAAARNFPANRYPFRASSHFLYFAGLPLQNAVVYLDQGHLTLFMDDPPPSSELWHGKEEPRSAIAQRIGADAAYPLSGIDQRLSEPGAIATVAVQDPVTRHAQARALGRAVGTPADQTLAEAIVKLRVIHDDQALAQMRQAATVTAMAHRAGMAATATARRESDLRSAMEAVILGQGMATAYNSIVTVQGEVLHNERYHNPVTAGDLLLADVGAETALGWAADVTRTWPISGQFSSTQRDIYEVVLAAHDAAIAALAPGVEYRDIHWRACRTLTEGLVALGILTGKVDDLLEQDAHALFFPHGVGHLLGLDVHDMEDLGDVAGYAPGRRRSDRFGLGYLRLDRPLQAGMVVTIEPGFYQVPAILNDPQRRSRYQEMVNWPKLSQLADVRGIRIEDDVLITAAGPEVLTAELPTQATAIEALVAP
ncbi:MAG: aminopeptidase P family protein [Cyanobacteria bacterium P01_A01_bin.135]